MHSLNTTVFRAINGLAEQSYYVDRAFIWITTYLIYALFVGAIIYMWYDAYHRRHNPLQELHAIAQTIYIVVSTAVTWFLILVLKFFLAIPRPFEMLSFAKVLVTAIRTSFPSEHSALAMSIATAFFIYHPKIGKYAIMLALVIGVSRVYVGVHYPLDVVVGWAIGYFVPQWIHNVFSRGITNTVKSPR